MEENLVKKSKNTNSALQIFLILIIILGVCGISYFIYENTLKEENLEQENGNEEEKKYTLDIYKYVSNGDICGSQTSYCNEFAFSIETETENAKILSFNSELKVILYEDNGIKLYDANSSITKKLNIKNSYEHFFIDIDYKTKELIGIRCSNYDNSNDYYSFKVDKILYKNYDYIYYSSKYLDAKKDNVYYYLDYKEEKIVFQSDSSIIRVIDDYKLYTSKSKLYIEKLDDTEKVELFNLPINENLYLHSVHYYTKEELIKLDKEEYGEGIYVILSRGNGTGYEIYYDNRSTQIVEVWQVDNIMEGMAKPVLYLYPTKEIKVKVSFSNTEYLTTTYPKYNNGWEVKVSPNGDMYDKDGKYYYALYWDEKRYCEIDFKEGFYVTKENAINFLEEKLSVIGLNDRERNEFIMYWLPILENNKQSLVYFELTEEREKNNKLIIEPRPDSMLRVSIHVKKVDEYVNIKEQKLKTFKRGGFTAIEWGGMTY